MRRWLLISLALASVAAALFVLARGHLGLGGGGGPPLDQIDDASRARLERVLEEARDVDPRPDPGAR